MLRVLAFLTAALAPTLAQAHVGAGATAGLAAGFVHPLGGLDHLLAMLTVGLIGGLLGGRAAWLVPASFLGMMVVGGALGAAGIGLPHVEAGIAVSVLVLGLAAAAGAALPVAAACALAGLFAVFHGHAHGAEMPETASGLAYGFGFVAATALLHGAGLGLGLLLGRADRTPVDGRILGRFLGRYLGRIVGGGVAAAGVALLANLA